MSRLVVLVLVCLVPNLVSAKVQSCYACAGPQSECTFTNRTDFLKMDCSSFKVEGKTLIERSSQVDLLEKFDSEVSVKESDDLGCITITFNHESNSPKQRALKSCVPSEVFGQDICTYMKGVVDFIGGETAECHFCKTDNCNSAISNLISAALLVIIGLIHLCFNM